MSELMHDHIPAAQQRLEEIDVGDLYDPIADSKQIALRVEAANKMIVRDDPDLLFDS